MKSPTKRETSSRNSREVNATPLVLRATYTIYEKCFQHVGAVGSKMTNRPWSNLANCLRINSALHVGA